MNRAEREFVVGNRPHVVVETPSVDVVAVEGDPGAIRVVIEGTERDVDLFDVTQAGDMVSIGSRRGGGRLFRRGPTIRLTVPAGTAFTCRTASGDVRLNVATSSVEIKAASGDVDIEACSGRVRVKTASGDIAIGAVTGDARLAASSGDVRVDRAEGDLTIATASGDASVGTVDGSVEVNATSGDIKIRRFSGSSFKAGTMSGDLDIGLAPGMAIDADIRTRSGKFRNLVEPSAEAPSFSATMSIRTMSGDVTLR